MNTATQERTLSTKDVVVDMLRENTGRSIVDSGDYYGRAWQRNQTVDFDNEPAAWARFDVAGTRLHILGTVSLYHWMTSMLEYDAELQARLDQHAQGFPQSVSWFTVQDDFVQKLFEAGDLARESRVTYTYNTPDSCDLSQNIQYISLYTESDFEPSHLIVMVHNGCDARMGFTAPKCFRITNDDDYLDAMRLSGIYAGDESWYITSWNSSEPSERNTCKVDLRDLFTMRLGEALEKYTPDDVKGLLDGAKWAKERLNNTTLTDAQKARSCQIIDENTERLRTEAMSVTMAALAEEHDWFVLVDNGKAWLFDHNTATFAEGRPLDAFNDYV